MSDGNVSDIPNAAAIRPTGWHCQPSTISITSQSPVNAPMPPPHCPLCQKCSSNMSDTFNVCYEVTSVNTAEPRSAMRDSDRRNTGKSVDHGLVMEWSVAGAAERSGIKKNKGKIAISLHIHCTSTDHTSADHPKHKCNKYRMDEKCLHNNLKCANCNGNHAANDPGCPMWIKQRGLLKDAGPMQWGPPPGG